MKTIGTFMGIRVVSHPLLDGWKRPVIEISPKVAEILSWSPRGREVLRDVNAYLLATFGENEIAIVTQDTMFLSPKHTAMLLMRAKNLETA